MYRRRAMLLQEQTHLKRPKAHSQHTTQGLQSDKFGFAGYKLIAVVIITFAFQQ